MIVMSSNIHLMWEIWYYTVSRMIQDCRSSIQDGKGLSLLPRLRDQDLIELLMPTAMKYPIPIISSTYASFIPDFRLYQKGVNGFS